VTDVERSLRFYASQLGFRAAFSVGSPPVYAAATPSAWNGSLTQIRFAQAATSVPAAELIIHVDDIDRLYERYRAGGVALDGQLESMPWALREFSVRDPDGYRLRFTGQ
jgi:catechol 2,3-dioxygenase-like lactoylglutathione lyase family enzyme